MALEFKKAVRKSVPMLVSISGTSGSGKTYSALLLAAGIAGPSGKVGLVDTENGRGEMYADSPGIKAALPNGYLYLRFDPPFTPERYVEHLTAAEQAGITVCIVDSGSHEWEGIGGVSEAAEKAEGKMGRFGKWAGPKMSHKRFVYYCLSSPMNIIFCLRARDKVKQFKRGDQIILGPGQETSDAPVADRDVVVPLGLQAICEKNFQFEQLVSLMLDEHTHCAAPVKVPEPLLPLFPGKHLLTKADGERIAQWNGSGAAQPAGEQLQKRARAAAEDGTAAYVAFFGALSKADKNLLVDSSHAENKAVAARADGEVPDVESLPDAVELVVGTRMRCKGDLWVVEDSEEGYFWRKA